MEAPGVTTPQQENTVGGIIDSGRERGTDRGTANDKDNHVEGDKSVTTITTTTIPTTTIPMTTTSTTTTTTTTTVKEEVPKRKLDEGLKFQKWPHTKSLHNLVLAMKELAAKEESAGRTLYLLRMASERPVAFRAKVKLHGMNAAVTMEAAGLRVQTRSQFSDGSQLGELVYANEAFFRELFPLVPCRKLTIYGEYCGPKVQKGVALTLLKDHIWAVFAIQIDDDMIIEPERIDALLRRGGKPIPPHIYVLPWHAEEFELHLTDEEQMKTHVETINRIVDAIDTEDPWVQQTFGLKGPGEGVVCYPVGFVNKETGLLPREVFSTFMFKAKGKRHRVTTADKAAQLSPDKVDDAYKYADMMLPLPRLEQGVQVVGGLDGKNGGKFVGWVVKDIEREGADELNASGLTWKQVAPIIADRAKTWFFKQLRAECKEKRATKQKEEERKDVIVEGDGKGDDEEGDEADNAEEAED